LEFLAVKFSRLRNGIE